MSGTTRINVRDLGPDDKKKIKELLRYGDVGKIAVRCTIGYQRVSDVISKELDHDQVWIAALLYFKSLPEAELDGRLESYLNEEAA